MNNIQPKLIALHSIMWSFSIISLFFLSWQSILLFLLIAYFISIIGQFVGMHRYFSHKSFRTNKFWHYFILFCSTIVTVGSPISWVAVHLKHHRFSDTEKDSHSPEHKGYFKVFFGYFYDIYDLELKYAVRLMRDKDHVFVAKHYFKLHLAYVVMLLAINPVLVFPLYFYPTVLSLVMAGAINVFNHWNGTLNDSKLLAWITGGEGWHKYHHDNPSKWKLLYPDLCGFLINLIRIRKS